jgi:acyl-CoA synthetase (AMP-forming)/AMP-acid ligase II
MTGKPADLNAALLLTQAARLYPERSAIVSGELSRTYRELSARALSLGGELRARGLAKGDRVAFALQNCPEILEIIFGCFAAGLVVVPLNARLHPREMAYIASNSGSRVLVHGADFTNAIDHHATEFGGVEQRYEVGGSEYEKLIASPNALAAPVEVDVEDPSWLFYTSGTTGRPKGATWTHRTVRIVTMNYLADVYNIQHTDIVLHAAPMSHGSGIVALPAIARGAANHIMPSGSFDPAKLLEYVQDKQVSHIAFLAPTQIVRTVEDVDAGAYDLSSLNAVCYGGAPIYVENLKAAIKAFGPVFVQIYGQGEAPITATALPAAQHEQFLDSGDPRIGSAGFTRTDVSVQVVDADDRPLPPGSAGEICIRGDIVMAGYWNDPEATAAALRNGWLHTGDIGSFDEHGYLFLLDRVKDMIVTGGNNVYPREVEEVLITHPDVSQVVVIGIPDDYWGEAVHAVVVLEDGAATPAADLIAYCGEHLAGYKKPKSVAFLPELPVSGYGKVLRREIRDTYWAGRERKIGGG